MLAGRGDSRAVSARGACSCAPVRREMEDGVFGPPAERDLLALGDPGGPGRELLVLYRASVLESQVVPANGPEILDRVAGGADAVPVLDARPLGELRGADRERHGRARS